MSDTPQAGLSAETRYRSLAEAADHCCMCLATVAASLEGIGDEEMYEWAQQAYEAAAWLRNRLKRPANVKGARHND